MGYRESVQKHELCTSLLQGQRAVVVVVVVVVVVLVVLVVVAFPS